MSFVHLQARFILLVILALILASCAANPPAAAAPAGPDQAVLDPVELNVFAAVSLTDAFTEIGQIFESNHPGARVLFNFAGSHQLAQQINAGAPADLFASANPQQMQIVIDAGEIAVETPQTFVTNRLVMVFPKDNRAGVRALQDLGKPGVKVVLASPEVPVGQYSLDFLNKASADPVFGSTFNGSVLKNVVSYEDNVRMVLTKVALGEADAGLVYTSDISGSDTLKVDQLDIPDELNVIATYPIAPLRTSEKPELAQAFIDLVLSKEGQDILAGYHFIAVK